MRRLQPCAHRPQTAAQSAHHGSDLQQPTTTHGARHGAAARSPLSSLGRPQPPSPCSLTLRPAQANCRRPAARGSPRRHRHHKRTQPPPQQNTATHGGSPTRPPPALEHPRKAAVARPVYRVSQFSSLSHGGGGGGSRKQSDLVCWMGLCEVVQGRKAGLQAEECVLISPTRTSEAVASASIRADGSNKDDDDKH